MSHYPVMFKNVIAAIEKRKIMRPFYVADCNFGLGGHSKLILQKFPNSHVHAWQLDPEMYQKYINNPQLHENKRLQVYNENFITLSEKKFGNKFDVVLADLGFNSLQLQSIQGLSWNKDSELDMRYSPQFQKCSDLINRITTVELVDLLIKYGDLNSEEAKLAAKKIEQNKPIKTTLELRDSIVGCFQKNKTKKIAQAFQAFRIATNKQMDSLRTLMENMGKSINKNGVIMCITFHSLQRDQIHRAIKQSKMYSKIETVKPSSAQIVQNSRSHSAQMLKFTKIV